MSVEKFYEKRQTPRRLLERLARLQIKEGAEFHFCLVTDIPAGGVRIHVDGFEVPEVFVLLFPRIVQFRAAISGMSGALGKTLVRSLLAPAPDIINKGMNGVSM
jgi:hypothetical protein